MIDQLSIFDDRPAVTVELQEPEPERELSIAERFDRFDSANPHVYRALVRLARQLRGRGHRRLGIKMLFEVLRWQSMLQTTDTDRRGFKLTNDFTSHYARQIMDREPDLDEVFTTRPLRSD